MINDFEILHELGTGSFSTVYKVRRKSNGQLYALKKVKIGLLKQKERENALNEVRFLASIDSPNIVQYKEAFYDDSSSCLCTVMEYLPGGTLQEKINSHRKRGIAMDEQQIWSFAMQLLQGLRHLHDLKIIHRDIKSANIFLSKSQKELKIGDLNVSKVLQQGLLYTQTGTPYYASPEIWQDKPYDYKSDIWSVGCVIYEMAALRPPFQGLDILDLCKKVCRAVFPRIPSHYTNELNNIIGQCLRKDPGQRSSCEELLKMESFYIHALKELSAEDVRRMLKNLSSEDLRKFHSEDLRNLTIEDVRSYNINCIYNNNNLRAFDRQQSDRLLLNDKNANKENLLLKTIRVPKNLNSLAFCLPKAKYSEEEEIGSRRTNNKSVLLERNENLILNTEKDRDTPMLPSIKRRDGSVNGRASRNKVVSVIRTPINSMSRKGSLDRKKDGAEVRMPRLNGSPPRF